MAVTYGFFNSVNGDRKYNAEQMSEYFRGIVNEGVFQHLDGGLAVTAGTGLAVSVASGRAIIQNRWVQNSDAMTLSISAASETYARKDAVVVRLNYSTRSIEIAVKAGTPAASPSAPSMTRNSTTYEMALAYVNVAANATSVTITDKRSDSTVCGWVTVAQSTSGEVDAQLNAMKTGFDGVEYDSPVEMVHGCDDLLDDKITDLKSATSDLEDSLGSIENVSKNIINIEDAEGSSNFWGIAWSIEDNVISLNGKATGNFVIKLSGTPTASIDTSSWASEHINIFETDTNYFASVYVQDGTASVTPVLSVYDNSNNLTLSTYNPSINNGKFVHYPAFIGLSIGYGNTFTNAKIAVQIEKGTSSSGYEKPLLMKFVPLSNIKRVHVVDINGNGDYTSIQDAVDASSEGDEIIIFPGEYEEAVDLKNKFLYVHGYDPYNTIIFNTLGDYDHCPLWVGPQTVENLTLYAKKEPNEDYSGLRPPYAVHLDQRWGSTKTAIFRHCRFFNDFGGEIGTGVIDGVHIIVDDCYAEDNIVNANAMQVHGDTTGTGVATIDIINSTLKVVKDSGNGRGLLFSNGGSQYNIGTKIKFKVNNTWMTRYYNNCGNIVELDSTSYGNNLTELNP
jgi:hypothetical protein